MNATGLMHRLRRKTERRKGHGSEEGRNENKRIQREDKTEPGWRKGLCIRRKQRGGIRELEGWMVEGGGGGGSGRMRRWNSGSHPQVSLRACQALALCRRSCAPSLHALVLYKQHNIRLSPPLLSPESALAGVISHNHGTVPLNSRRERSPSPSSLNACT